MPAFQVTVQPSGRTYPASDDRSVLRSALDAGVPLPSSCRNGTCRTCICRLDSGRVSYTVEWPGLSAEEKLQGYMLPCVALPRSDLVLQCRAVGLD